MAGSLIDFPADALKGNTDSTCITLSGTPGTVTTVTIPVDAQGFGLRPAAAICRWNLDEAVAAEATVATNDQTAVASDLANGGYAFSGEWTWHFMGRTGASGVARTLYLLSATASAVIYVEFF